MKPSQLLRFAAAEVIPTPATWVQGTGRTVRDGKHCFCALIALSEAAKRTDSADFTALGALRAVVGNSVVEFNDAPGRAHAEVLQAFDKAASNLEAQGR